MPTGYLSSAVYSLDLALANSSGRDIPSSSKHRALFSTGRSPKRGWQGRFFFFLVQLGQTLNREAVFPRVQARQ